MADMRWLAAQVRILSVRGQDLITKIAHLEYTVKELNEKTRSLGFKNAEADDRLSLAWNPEVAVFSPIGAAASEQEIKHGNGFNVMNGDNNAGANMEREAEGM